MARNAHHLDAGEEYCLPDQAGMVCTIGESSLPGAEFTIRVLKCCNYTKKQLFFTAEGKIINQRLVVDDVTLAGFRIGQITREKFCLPSD